MQEPATVLTPGALAVTDWDGALYRVYDTTYGCDAFVPGVGDTRFAAVVTAAGTVSHLYGGATEVVVLLETVLRDVVPGGGQVLYEHELRQRGLVKVATPRVLRLADLRDPELDRLGVPREALTTTPAEHYACTRTWATHVHDDPVEQVDGLVWHSRQAEHATALGLTPLSPDDREVVLLFGDRAPSAPGDYERLGAGVISLVEGPGRLLVDGIADDLDVIVDPAA